MNIKGVINDLPYKRLEDVESGHAWGNQTFWNMYVKFHSTLT